MADPFLGEIIIGGFNFAVQDYSFANGQLLPVGQFTALFSLLGTSFGGNGTADFALPNIAGLAVCGPGQGPGLSPRIVGEEFGETAVTLMNSEIPMHNHMMVGYTGSGRGYTADGTPTQTSALARSAPINAYAAGTPNVAMAPNVISPSGGSQPHSNVQPLLGLNYQISLYGTYPTFG